MKSKTLIPFFCVLFLPLHGLRAAAPTVKISIAAADTDRRMALVTFPLPAGAIGVDIAEDGGGRRLPVQIEAADNAEPTASGGARTGLRPNWIQSGQQRNVTFMLPELARGQIATFKLLKLGLGSDSTCVRDVREGRTLNFSQNGKPILTYQMEPGDAPAGVPEHCKHGAHLHPVFSPSGKLVTGNHPPDHRWHRGIWFGWTDTEFEGRHPDFWNMGKEKDGQLTGEVRFEGPVVSWSGAVHGGFVSQHRWIDHTSGAEKDVLRETWEVKVYQTMGVTYPLRVFDLTSTQTCAGKEPLKLPKYHYGGLGVRGNAAWDPMDKVAMLTSEGHDRQAGDATKGKWVWLGGDVDGGPTGMAILIHPDNFRFPQPLRLNPKNPQLCVAPSQDGDWEITPGKPYVSRYRFVVFDGTPDAAELDRLWNGYAHPPKVTVE